MTSLDRLPLTTAPDLDPSRYNHNITPSGSIVTAYYSPSNNSWLVAHCHGDTKDLISPTKRMHGIDATDWPEVWAEIISKEQ